MKESEKSLSVLDRFEVTYYENGLIRIIDFYTNERYFTTDESNVEKFINNRLGGC